MRHKTPPDVFPIGLCARGFGGLELASEAGRGGDPHRIIDGFLLVIQRQWPTTNGQPPTKSDEVHKNYCAIQDYFLL
jgi:hypothetical protein